MTDGRPSRTAIAIAIMLVVVGTIGAIGSWGAYLLDTDIEANGVRTEGHLLKKRILSSADGSDFILEHRFALPSGERVDAQAGVSREFWLSLREGQTLPVVYSAGQPKRNFPLGAGVTSLTVTMVVSLLSALIAAFGGIVLFSLLGAKRPAP